MKAKKVKIRFGYWQWSFKWAPTIHASNLPLFLYFANTSKSDHSQTSLILLIPTLALFGSVAFGPWWIRSRCFLELDAENRTIRVQGLRKSLELDFDDATFRIPRYPSVFPSLVRVANRNGARQWRRCLMLSQGYLREPPELERFLMLLTAHGIEFEVR